MNPSAAALLVLKGLLDLIPLAMKNAAIFAKRGEYTVEEWNAVKAQAAKFNTDPAWQIDPNPGTTGTK